MRKLIKVYAFIDWNTQIHNARCPHKNPIEVAEHTLDYVCRSLGVCLNNLGPELRYDVDLRLYHGWRKGFEETENKKAITIVVSKADFSGLSARPNVNIRPEVSFGDRLYAALDTRMHAHISAHLPNTLRRNPKDELRYQEKMVDTAMASDIVNVAHRNHDAWLIAFGRDDDIIPAIFTAEAVSTVTNRHILVVRQAHGKFLKLDGLAIEGLIR